MPVLQKGRYAPPVHMIRPPVHVIRLTQARENTPYVWVPPDDDDRR